MGARVLAHLVRGTREYGVPLVFAASVLVSGAPAVPILGIRGAVAFGILLSAWLLFARVLVAAVVGHPVTQMVSLRVGTIACSVVSGGAAIVAAAALDVRLVWGALCAVAFSEWFYWR
ncbi:MAG: hypothetical protein JO315_21680 [Acidobacteria bacterium]|nr:hypothetical protein [Acidobacteriota bacterium]